MRIIICGSMTAAKDMLVASETIKKLGHEPVLPLFVEDYITEGAEKKHVESAQEKVTHDLIRAHYEKIKAGDAILVINNERKGIPGYIGGNTFLEMGFAHVLDKPIFALYPLPAMGYADELQAMQPRILDGDMTKMAHFLG